MDTTIAVTITPGTVGMYGCDEQGQAWGTFELLPRGRTVPCDICGRPISYGWQRGFRGDGPKHVCSDHVTVKRGTA